MSLVKARSTHTAIDAIIGALQKGDLSFLSQDELNYYNMLSFADDILRDYKNHGNGSRHMAGMIKAKYNVSEVTAYKILNDARYVFRTVNILDKDHWRSVLVDMQMKLYKLMMVNPQKNFRNLNQAISNMTKLLGLDQKDADPIPLDKLGGNKYVMVIQVEGQLKELPLSSLLNMKEEEKQAVLDMISKDAAEVSFEEILPPNPDDEPHQTN